MNLIEIVSHSVIIVGVSQVIDKSWVTGLPWFWPVQQSRAVVESILSPSKIILKIQIYSLQITVGKI